MKTKRLYRFLASLLVLVLMVTAIPASLMSDFVSIEAEAKTNGVVLRINSFKSIFKTKSNGKMYFTTNGQKCGNSACDRCCLPNIVKQNPDIKSAKISVGSPPRCWSCFAFAEFAYYYIYGSYTKLSNSHGGLANTVAHINPTGKSTKELSQWFSDHVKEGDLLAYGYVKQPSCFAGNSSKDIHHFAIYTGMNSNKTSMTYMNGNASGGAMILNDSMSFSYMASKKDYAIRTLYVVRAPNYNKVAGLVPSISNVSASNAGNTSVKLTASLAFADTTTAWGYFLSENKNEVANVDATNVNKHKSTSSMEYVLFYKGTQSEKSRSVTVNKFKGSPLKAGTTYYYKIVVAIGGSRYQSKVGSFTTAKVVPDGAKLRVGKGSDAVGIGAQVSLLWDAANLADYYDITVKDAAGETVQTKTNIKGVNCVLDGISKAGLYTAYITSVNAAGRKDGTSVQFSVMPDREITYVDTFDQPETIVDTQSVRPGSQPSEPKGPEHEGHTFSKWTLVSTSSSNSDAPEYEKVVKERYEAVYDKKSYNVTFVDSFTNQVLKTETVKYKESAYPPAVTVPEDKKGYEFDRWDADYRSITNDTEFHTVYKWADSDHAATIDENTVSVKRIDAQLNTDAKLGYEIECTITNHISEVLSGRLVAVLKTNNDTILTSVESSAFAIDVAAVGGTSRTVKMTVLYSGLADKIELYVINGYESLGKLSATLSKNIDNRNGFSEWTAYEGECPMSGANVETTEVTESTPEKKYYRYRLREETTSTATSLSGYTQNGYTAQKKSSGSVDYVKSWNSGFDTNNAYYKKYNKTPVTAGETATQITKIDSTSTTGYLYWHWCRGAHLGSPTNRCINYSKTSTYSKFHCFVSTKNPSSLTYTDGAYKFVNADACDDTYWWGYTPVLRQNYTIYNKVYNYYKLSEYTEWIEYEGDVPVAENSLIDGKKIVNIETKIEPASSVTTKYYRYSTENPTIEEPTPAEGQVVSISGSVGEAYKGKPVTVWVYKYAQASDYTTEFAATTTVADDGSISIDKAFLREVPTVESGDYKIAASVEGQARAVDIGVIEAPKPVYTVKFYGFAANGEAAQVISEQQIKEGGNAVVPGRNEVAVPEGYRFTNWSQSVINVRSDMDVYPESELETYTVAFVNWENQTVSMKNFLYGSELVADDAPEGKDGFVTEWVVRTGDKEQTLDDYSKAGGRVNGNMVVVTRSEEQTYEVKFIGAKVDAMLTKAVPEENIETVFREEEASGEHKKLEVVDDQKVKYGDNISFEKVQPEVEESEEIVFLGWINAYTGLAVDDTTVTESMLLYPAYIFPETAAQPTADVESGEYTSEQTITLTSETENAVIWYTLDGTDPTTSDTAIEYKSPIKLAKSAMVIYYASAMGMNDSSLSTSIYAVNTGDTAAYHIVEIDYSSVTMADSDPVENAVYLVKDGSKLKNLKLVEVDGNTLDGLYFDESYTEFFDTEEEVVSESMTLYAHYTANTYTVEFIYIDENGKEQIIDSQKVKYPEGAKEPKKPELKGKVFAGWDTPFESISHDTKVKARFIDEDEYATITLSRTKKLSLAAGTSYTKLKAAITPDFDYEIVWSSSDPTIAEVDEKGVINALKTGDAVITATLPYTGASATLAVHVTADLDTTIIFKSSATASFDDARNIRNVKESANTAAQILDMFINEDLVILDAKGNKLGGTDKVGTGASVCLYDGSEVIDSARIAVVGDYDGSGTVDAKDVVMMNQFAVGKRDINDIQAIAADVNGDGVVNNKDCASVSRYLVGKETI